MSAAPNAKGPDVGRGVLITGAGNGLGRAFARAWAARGARVVVNNRRRDGEPSSADAVVAEIRAAGGEAVADYSEVRDADAPQRMIGAALEAFGQLDAVIFNAGVSGPATRFETQTQDAFREVMDINLFANIDLAQAALPHVRTSAAGRLLFVASTAGFYGVRGRAPYAASKGALIATALTLARELKREGVGVNVLAPYAATRMTPADLGEALGERLHPDRAAPMAVWLTSAACMQTSEIWTAGADHVRRARMEEGSGGGPAGAARMTPEWIAENLDRLGDMSQGAGYPDAEAAFAGFMAELDRAG